MTLRSLIQKTWKKAIPVVAAVAGGAAIAAAMPGPMAVGSYSPPLLLKVAIAPQAGVTARGHLVGVPVQVLCPGAKVGLVRVILVQRKFFRVTEGSGSEPVRCGKKPAVAVVWARERIGGRFWNGTAEAFAIVYACKPASAVCGTGQVSRRVHIDWS